MNHTIRLGTRGSRLALIQTGEIHTMLVNTFPGLEITVKIIKTEGDSDRTSPLTHFGGRGAFVRSLESALLSGEIDAAIHSLKDLPSRLPAGLVLGAVPVREDPRDVLVSRDGKDIMSLPSGSMIATGSERRKAQIRCLRSDIIFTGIRGNVETRLRKLNSGKIDAIVLAAAGLKRLGLESRISQFLEYELVIPAPCQGALGVECRADDDETRTILSRINNTDIRTCVDAERAFIATLEMGCHMPIGAFAWIDGDTIVFSAFIAYGKKGKILRKTCRTLKKNVLNEVREMALQFREQTEQSS
ncbi:MAG TPA: hydroxymethylbilane synthase [Anaerolineae bacterium]|nr:hydroxymethylbilane synthase [Anaerolineae bacterium]